MCIDCNPSPVVEEEPADFLSPVKELYDDGKMIRYRDADRDQLELSRGEWTPYHDNEEGKKIPVFYVKCLDPDGNEMRVVRVPVEVLIEMLDQIGVRVFPEVAA